MKKKITELLQFIEFLEGKRYYQTGEIYVVLKAIKDKIKSL